MPQLELVRTERFPERTLAQVRSGGMNEWPAQRLLAWGFENFAPRIALSASFGSPEGMVILDLMHRIDPERARVFSIDTGRLPQETYDLMDRVRDRYGIEVEIHFPEHERVESMVRKHGPNLFFESKEKRELCCGVRKVAPLDRALAGLDAWVAGLRPEHSKARADVRSVEVDHIHGGRIKLNPLASWSRDDVEQYVHDRGIPVNALHARGYPSVGCAPCSRATKPGEDERAGRWSWERDSSRECGIHVGYERDGSGI